MNFREYVVMRLGGEERVNQLAADKEIRIEMETLLEELGGEAGRMLAMFPQAMMERYIGNLLGWYRASLPKENQP